MNQKVIFSRSYYYPNFLVNITSEIYCFAGTISVN